MNSNSILHYFDQNSIDFCKGKDHDYIEYDIFTEYNECKDYILQQIYSLPHFIDIISTQFQKIQNGSRVTLIIKGGKFVSGKVDWKAHGKKMIEAFLENPTFENMLNVNVKISIIEKFIKKQNEIFNDKNIQKNYGKILDIRKKLLTSNQRLIYSIVKKYNKDLDTEIDLLQDGSMGLIYSIDMFNHKEDIKFSTYSTWWVRQYISKSIGKYDNAIHVPASVRNLTTKVYKLYTESHDAQKVATELGIDIKKVYELLGSSNMCTSLNIKIGDSDDELIDTFVDGKNVSEEINTISFVKHTIQKLDNREQTVIKLRFGIDATKEHTLEEVGGIIGVTRERARQIEKKALRKMEKHAKKSM